MGIIHEVKRGEGVTMEADNLSFGHNDNCGTGTFYKINADFPASDYLLGLRDFSRRMHTLHISFYLQSYYAAITLTTPVRPSMYPHEPSV